MIWDKDPLFAKAKLFLERALALPTDDPQYGLWCSLGLELLARAAIASKSPTLLAEPDQEQTNLLHALGFGQQLASPKSIAVSRVLTLCQILFVEFTKEDFVSSMALVNRRNAELHSGEAAFDSYPAKQWLPSFYRSCSALATVLGETLESLFGAEPAGFAREVLKESREGVLGKVKNSIAAYKKVFDAKDTQERQDRTEDASKQVERLVHERHHKVLCPACGSDAVVNGDTFGPEKIENKDDEIIIRQSVFPRIFACTACGLKLTGYAELEAADLGGVYNRTTTASPEDYYGLIDPRSSDMSGFVDDYLREMAEEYDNE